MAIGGKFKSGGQWVSWIALDDEVGAIIHLLTNDIAGPVNLTAPNPVTNLGYTRTLGAVLHRPTALPIPSFGPKLLLGKRAGREPAVPGPAGAAQGAGGQRLPVPLPRARGGAEDDARPVGRVSGPGRPAGEPP